MKKKIFLLASLLFVAGMQLFAAGKIGYIVASESTDFMDDDELASYEWFKATYPEEDIITCSAIEAGKDLSGYQVLWLHIDQKGLLKGAANLPAAYTSNAVVNAIKAYYNNGGNLFLANHATQYLTLLGRLAEDRTPNIFGSGEGGEGTDNWSFVANIGYHPEETREYYNHEGHAIYEGLEFKAEANPGWNHNSCLLIGPGTREDHNCMWDLNAFGYSTLFPDATNVVKAFEQENTAVVLGTWGHVTDYCCAGIVELEPTATCKGRCIAIGLAAYEWSQNSGTNPYQNTLERLTSNILTYLSNNESTAIDEAHQSEGRITADGRTICIEGFEAGERAQVYTAAGAWMFDVLLNGHNTIHVSEAGLYLVKVGNQTLKVVLK